MDGGFLSSLGDFFGKFLNTNISAVSVVWGSCLYKDDGSTGKRIIGLCICKDGIIVEACHYSILSYVL